MTPAAPAGRQHTCKQQDRHRLFATFRRQQNLSGKLKRVIESDRLHRRSMYSAQHRAKKHPTRTQQIHISIIWQPCQSIEGKNVIKNRVLHGKITPKANNTQIVKN